MTEQDTFEPSKQLTDWLFQTDKLIRKPRAKIISSISAQLSSSNDRQVVSKLRNLPVAKQNEEVTRIASSLARKEIATRVSKERIVDAAKAAQVPGRLGKLRVLISFAEEHFGSVPLFRPKGATGIDLPAYDFFDAQNHVTLESCVGEGVPVLDPSAGDNAEDYRQALNDLPGIVWEKDSDKARKSLFGLLSADIVSVARRMSIATNPLTSPAFSPGGAPPGAPSSTSLAHVWFTLTTHTPGIQVLWWWWALYGGFTPMRHLTSHSTNQTIESMHSGGVGFSRVDPSHTSSVRYIDDPSRHAVGPTNPDGSTTSSIAF